MLSKVFLYKNVDIFLKKAIHYIVKKVESQKERYKYLIR